MVGSESRTEYSGELSEPFSTKQQCVDAVVNYFLYYQDVPLEATKEDCYALAEPYIVKEGNNYYFNITKAVENILSRASRKH